MQVQVEGKNLSPLTLSGRRTGLTQAREVKDPDGDRMGSLSADMPEEAFIHIYDSFGSRTGAAETCLKALRAAYKWGQDRGFPKNGAVLRVKSTHRSKGGATPWSSADAIKFLKYHGPGTMARLWFCLAYATHGRIGDAPTLGPDNEFVHDGERHLEWQPRKKGSAYVSLPFDGAMAEELENHPERETYLATDYGRPFASSGSLDNRVRKWIIAAGLCVEARATDGSLVYEGTGKRKVVKKLATRSQHGIRKGVAELMAENGATEYELMASFGWTDARTAAIYTKKFQRRGAATAASNRIPTAQGGPRSNSRGPQAHESTSKIKEKSMNWQPVGESNPSFQVENLAS